MVNDIFSNSIKWIAWWMDLFRKMETMLIYTCKKNKWNWKICGHTAIFQIDNQQVLALQHIELCSILWGSLETGEFRVDWMHVYVCLSPFIIHLKLLQHCQNEKLKYIYIYISQGVFSPTFCKFQAFYKWERFFLS